MLQYHCKNYEMTQRNKGKLPKPRVKFKITLGKDKWDFSYLKGKLIS